MKSRKEEKGNSSTSYIIGVDTGGTFTDAVVINQDGVITTAKALSTPPHFEEGVVNALENGAKILKKPLDKILRQTKIFKFGGTMATNAIMTRTGATTGLITTSGFEDIIAIARGTSKWFGLPEADIKHEAATRKPDPIVPKNLIAGAIERIDRDGEVVYPLNSENLREKVKKLLDMGVESLAISLLWSPRNPAHEKQVLSIVREMCPNLYVSLSSEVAPVVGEYERTITTILDSYIGEVTKGTLGSLSSRLNNIGLDAAMLVMKADGGCSFASEVLPIATVHSGPAAGLVCAAHVGKTLGYKDIISADVGGTTFDVSIVKNGEPSYSREPSIGSFGIAYPTLDITSIGAGGGTIAWFDEITETIHVGPKSAGSSPGPACYDFGGTQPTVTDACLILGYLDPDYFLGGEMKLNYEKAAAAVQELGSKIGMSLAETAAAIYRIINSAMSELMRGLTIRKGVDPREFCLLCFGGAGPMHAGAWGKELGIKEIVIPVAAATQSALGLAISDIIHTEMMPSYDALPMDLSEFNHRFENLEKKISARLDRDGMDNAQRTINYYLDMKYGLQYHVLKIPIPRKVYQSADMEFLANEFDNLYEVAYGKGAAYAAAGRYVSNFIVQGFGAVAKPTLATIKEGSTDPSMALKGKREAYFEETKKFITTEVYAYQRLSAGNVIEGPAIVEARQTSIVIHPSQKGYVDKYGNVIIRPI
jgi:N-methylhydantoinase A